MADESVNAIFRPSKRPKTFRRRADDEDDHAQHAIAQESTNVEHDQIAETPGDQEKDMQALQSRRPTKARRTGVNFSSASSPRPSNQTQETAIAKIDPTQSATSTAAGRFTAPTGQAVMKEDKHIMAYIDAQLANMRSERTISNNDDDIVSTVLDPQRTTKSQAQVSSSYARHGEVEEVEIQVTGEDGQVTRIRKERVRLGRDGKPLPPRKKRYERTADDAARDAMVERLLSENRFDNIYTGPSPGGDGGGDEARAGQDEDADARMADEFRREFLASAEENKARRQMGGAKATDMTKGPKMGGSKNQRVAAEKEKNKSTK